MKFAHILSSFYFQPWSIMPEKHQAMGRVLQGHLKGGAVLNMPAIRADGATVGPVYSDGTPVVQQMTTGAGVAIIPVVGVLGRHLDFLDLWCGGCDYDHISEMTALALADPAIHTLVYYFDSPGGQHIGMVECAAVIAAAGLQKPTVAYMDKLCASAAYGLASQCHEILAAPSAMVGSIGSYLAAIDTSREWEMMGWALELFRSGQYKAAGTDGKAWTAAEREYFQGQTDFCANQFKSLVTAVRPQVAAEQMQGQWFLAAQVSGSIVDDLVNSLQDVVDTVAQLAVA